MRHGQLLHAVAPLLRSFVCGGNTPLSGLKFNHALLIAEFDGSVEDLNIHSTVVASLGHELGAPDGG